MNTGVIIFFFPYVNELIAALEKCHGKSSIESRLDTVVRFQPPYRQTINPER